MKELEVTLEQLESTVVLHAVEPVDSTTLPLYRNRYCMPLKAQAARCSSIWRRSRT